MRSLLILLVFAASLAEARQFEEVRELTLPADGIDKLIINAGAGSLEVAGVAGLEAIRVTATVSPDVWVNVIQCKARNLDYRPSAKLRMTVNCSARIAPAESSS